MEEEKHIDARFGDNWKKYAKQLTKDELIEIALINGRKFTSLIHT